MQSWVDDLEKRTRAKEPRAVSEGCILRDMLRIDDNEVCRMR